MCFGSREIFCTMAWFGVRWYLPPKGITTVPAPIVLSNFSTSPRSEQILSEVMTFLTASILSDVSTVSMKPSSRPAVFTLSISISVCFSAPFEFRNSRERSIM